MRYVVATLLASAASVVMFVVSGVVLGIANIYLAGHGIDWPNQEIVPGMSPLSFVMLGLVFLTFVLVFGGTVFVANAGTTPSDD